MSCDWIKAAHVLSVLLFTGGLIALLLVTVALDSRTESGRDQSLRFKTALLLWDRRITVPAMVAAWGFGLWTASAGGWFSSGWLQAKLVLVVILSGLHGVLAGRMKRKQEIASEGEISFPPQFLLIACASVAGIVVLAVVKPG